MKAMQIFVSRVNRKASRKSGQLDHKIFPTRVSVDMNFPHVSLFYGHKMIFIEHYYNKATVLMFAFSEKHHEN